ncbi:MULTISPECIES: DUF3343 domain-containing protein [unclassified Adlercreutzia]|uniref:DUF3343 domain-containing protein n=1 Tax=unclassified Adlercreutzia TaxID=2636013 RepID=UPI0013EAA6BF|nr:MULTISPECIES: DUF3343 domain-containing protein [unclassified Adlercreutzia]
MPLSRNVRCYALLKTHTDVWALFEACKEAGVEARIAPTPRQADTHASCGTSLLVPCDTSDAVLALASERGIATNGVVRVQNAIDPARDRYC